MNNSSQSQGGGEKEKAIINNVIAKAWKDPGYKANLIQSPNAVLAEEGLTFPDDVKFVVLVATPSVRYIPLSRTIDHTKDTMLGQILSKILPIPEGIEIRIVQSTEALRYIVLPMSPDSVNVQATSVTDLSKLASLDSSVNVTQTVNVQTGVNVSTVVTVAEGEVAVVAVVAAAVVVT